jgi:hypothetical protein
MKSLFHDLYGKNWKMNKNLFSFVVIRIKGRHRFNWRYRK